MDERGVPYKDALAVFTTIVGHALLTSLGVRGLCRCRSVLGPPPTDRAPHPHIASVMGPIERPQSASDMGTPQCFGSPPKLSKQEGPGQSTNPGYVMRYVTPRPSRTSY